MALGYQVTITDSKGDTIVLSSMKGEHEGKEDIICASYKSNTLNDESIARSNDVRAEMRIIGRITVENKKSTCELANWAKETDSNRIYRTVKLVVRKSTSSNADILRSYEINNMFVLDYTEGYDISTENLPGELKNENDNGLFELYLVQKNGNYDQFIETE